MKMPPTIGAAIRFHTSDPVPVAHMIGMSPMNVVAIVMNFGRSRFAAPSTIVAWRSASVRRRPSREAFSVGEVEIQQHEDAGLGVDAEQRDQPDPDGDAHVVAEQVQVPDGADGRERHRQQHDRRLHQRPRVQVQEHHTRSSVSGMMYGEARAHAGHRLVLAAPEHRVAGRQLHLLAHDAARLVHVAADVAARDVDEDVSGEQPVLVADHRRSCRDLHARQLAESLRIIAGPVAILTAASAPSGISGWSGGLLDWNVVAAVVGDDQSGARDRVEPRLVSTRLGVDFWAILARNSRMVLAANGTSR